MRPANLTPIALAALLLSAAAQAQSVPGSPDPNAPDPNAEVKTLKERLSDKASDAQRVDNCKVPVDQQGTTPRPGCPAAPLTAAATKPP